MEIKLESPRYLVFGFTVLFSKMASKKLLLVAMKRFLLTNHSPFDSFDLEASMRSVVPVVQYFTPRHLLCRCISNANSKKKNRITEDTINKGGYLGVTTANNVILNTWDLTSLLIYSFVLFVA
ncbi:hypothetical protein EGR_05003 [Echinococcus granulosus]|uniref:Uncharacterized protein n=1 Tax=Echinococcus granulosus TaxID=6210 RepID=W6UFF0_ECHGR|nr:hypothetical protein EGR_05003 [Echinococcus granulosus]EUB60150.1 hypothetical protein EGR_05003 [Echinococcus granulosus]